MVNVFRYKDRSNCQRFQEQRLFKWSTFLDRENVQMANDFRCRNRLKMANVYRSRVCSNSQRLQVQRLLKWSTFIVTETIQNGQRFQEQNPFKNGQRLLVQRLLKRSTFVGTETVQMAMVSCFLLWLTGLLCLFLGQREQTSTPSCGGRPPTWNSRPAS